ncbi:cupin domain-containing protein [Pseudomonas entomophila]|uniref:cupin domain-containing protein n=1 Tax=Pseudomonas entomophila TaxID=312306 RepID=UPI0023D87D14|nr:cupin domain-containing protein [Pseudomonas entomophila]MDF0732154.1 cupin domain-containing protein [Pseudomonas entomophila]
MRHTHLIASAAVFAAFTGLAQAQDAKAWQQGIHRTDLTRSDLHVPGQEVIQVRVDFDPGVASPKHSHPGAEVAYVIAGTFEYRLAGRAPVTLKAGDSLFIPAGTAHVAANIGSTKASELATYIVSKRDPLLKLEE